MKTSDVLERMADKIRQGWCKYSNAENVFGWTVRPTSRFACKWCLMGSGHAVTHGIPDFMMPAIDYLRKIVGEGVSEWNDAQKSKKPVMAAILKARELALEAND